MEMQNDSAAIFAKDFSGPPARKISKNHAAALAFGCPSRPATLATSLCDVAAQLTGRDVGMLCNFTLRLRHGREIAQP